VAAQQRTAAFPAGITAHHDTVGKRTRRDVRGVQAGQVDAVRKGSERA
jgi:hypothetical protein